MAQQRNPGTALELDWLDDVSRRVAGADARAAEIAELIPASRGRAQDLTLAVNLLDLTSLNDSDTEETVRHLCARALEPIARELVAAAGPARRPPGVAAICVYDRFVPVARASLAGHAVRTAAVTAGFPWPHAELEQRLDEVRATVAAGADEIDLVIDRRLPRLGNWEALYDEMRSLREACGPARLKAILAAGDLGSLLTVSQAGLVCCMAGADFIKTSTGREEVNATLPIGVAMAAAIRSYRERTGHAVGLKAAGGIRSARQAVEWLCLVRETLGLEWLTRERFRIGASSLLDDLVLGLHAEADGAGRRGVTGKA
jgi:deoxyribose-phosphate aldolase